VQSTRLSVLVRERASGIAQMLLKLKRGVYFAATPWCNVPINLIYHHRLSRRYVPECIYIETTNYCNAHCIMCPHDKMKRPRGHMEWEIFVRVIGQCSAFEGRGLKVFLHKDGEPLMDPLLFRRIRFAKDTLKRSLVHFNTNAMLLTEDKVDHILESPLDSIVFSVDGASRDTYENVRRGLDYDVVTHNIDRFFARKAEMGRGPRAFMQMVVSKSNLHEVAAYQERWGEKADGILFKPMHNFLVQGTALFGGDVGSRQISRCTMPFHVLLVYQNGDIGLCCWDYDHLVDLGNVSDGSLLDLYNSQAFSRIRRAMKRKSCGDLSPCNVCSQIFGRDGPQAARELARALSRLPRQRTAS